MMINETINLLGKRGKDRVTGFSGVASSACFDLYGCVQVALTPSVDKDGKPLDGHWFDVQRIEFADEERVMPIPDFNARDKTPAEYNDGAAEKPDHRSLR